MLEAIEGLLVLQDRDRRLREVQRQLDAIPVDEQRARERLSSDEAAVARARESLQAHEVEASKLELEVETRQTTIARLKQQQFETRKNDEYRALANEVDRYAADIDTLETRQLEAMERADALRHEFAEAERALAATRAVVDEDLATIAERRQRLAGERDALTTERGELIAGVDPTLAKLYERLLKTKNGMAVAPVESGQCGGCHVRLIPATLIKVRAGEEVTQCENCGRILYES